VRTKSNYPISYVNKCKREKKKRKKEAIAIPNDPYVELILQLYVKPYIIFFYKKNLKIIIGYHKKMGKFVLNEILLVFLQDNFCIK
jgi:hypothetical protein